MVEITAVRLLLINLLRPVATGQSMTEKTFDSIVEETRKRKVEVAISLVEKALRG